MDVAQCHGLHSENFDLCRICLLEPESNRAINFKSVFGPSSDNYNLHQLCNELLQIHIDENDIKPKIICENCYKALFSWYELKKQSAESQIVLSYIAKKRFTTPALNQSSNASGGLWKPLNNASLAIGSHSSTSSQINPELSTSFEGKMQFQPGTSDSINLSNSSQAFTVNQTMIPVHRINKFDNETSSPPNDVIYVSSDSDDDGNKNSTLASCNDNLTYCSICQQKMASNHNCSIHNKKFSTCLVPNCNILARSIKDFTPHYRQHIGLPAGEKLCLNCFKENKRSEQNVQTGHHICTYQTNLFKCYACNIVLISMSEFAYHKLKIHNGRLINSSGSYLCFTCETSSPDLMFINEHIRNCRNQIEDNTQEHLTEHSINFQEAKEESYNNTNNASEVIASEQNYNHPTAPQKSAYHLLFTCLKPSCNFIFQYFQTFKFHHRKHFGIGNKLMCWQCCTPFNSIADLRTHQVSISNCRTPGMFKCFQCSEAYDNLQSLSIHKFAVHNGNLITNKKHRKNATCPSCRMVVDVNELRNHLIHNHSNEIGISKRGTNPSRISKLSRTNDSVSNNYSLNKTKLKPKLITKSRFGSYKCVVCSKVCLTAAALSSHMKVHNPNRRTKAMQEKINKERALTKSNGAEVMSTASSSASHVNDSIESTRLNLDDSNDNELLDSTPNTPQNKKMFTYIDNNQFPFVGGYFYCVKCPEKFDSKKELKEHWTYCSDRGSGVVFHDLPAKKNLPKNYYCTECEEGYTRSGFGAHWSLKHGKRLGFNRYKRFSCTYCPFKFLYKIALTMHYDHMHSDKLDSSKNTSTSVGCVGLPVVSNTISLANNCVETSVEDNEDNYSNQVEEVNTSTLLDSSNVKLESIVNNSENKMDDEINELDDHVITRNVEDLNLSNNNDNGDNINVENAGEHLDCVNTEEEMIVEENNVS